MSRKATTTAEKAPDVTGDPNYPWRHPIPIGWKTCRLGDVMDIVRGISFPKEAKSLEPRDGHVACLRTANVQRDVEWDDLWFVPEQHVKREDQYVCPGDILISTANSYDLVGKVAPVTTMPHRATLGAFISLLRPREELDAKFAYYQISWSDTQDRIRSTASTTTNISNVSTKKLSNIELAVPPLDQQQRIVAEIEKQFSRLDEAVTNLKRVKANLKRYKAAVLKAAVEGKLTQEWRKTHPDVEPASKLLERILAERRAKWEETELAKMKAKGKAPKNDKWKAKYKEPAAPETAGRLELPKGWEWSTVDQISTLVEYGSSAKTNENKGGVPVLRMGNIVDGEVVFDSLKYLPNSHSEFPRLLLVTGDLLFNRTNSPELVGKTAVFGGEHPTCSFASYLIRAQLAAGAEPYFFSSYINSSHGRSWIKSVVTQQVGQANVNGSKLKALNVPLPPQEEQRRIVVEVERRLSLIRAASFQVDANLRRADRLRQSILAKAFAGGLMS